MSNRDRIAVVGMGCRFSSADSLEELWKLIVDGRHGMKEVPPDRFDINKYHDPRPAARNRIVSREGGYLDHIRHFDAQLFEISYREACYMDPQQRILLEVAWSALQDAGFPLEQVDGARAGTYIGLFTSDFRRRLLARGDEDLDVYSEIGSTRSSTAGRIAHAFNLNGPTVAVDAACASSLVAIHLACQGLLNGETEFALAGGCNVILEPESTVCFSRSGMLSPESRCKFGDAGADGFVRSEGVGVVVLKRLDKATEDGDRIYAVISATACSNDARQGQGLYMTPSQEGQVTLLERVYKARGLPIDRLVYVEAHGTGTQAGDPVECKAIAQVLGSGRTSSEPLYIGSVKTNIGHAEGAAGVAGLMKAVLVLHHRLIPPSLHHKSPNPKIPWEEGRMAVPTAAVVLPGHGPLMAGVNSFGLSGTNAHAALETFEPAAPPTTQEARDAYVLPLSAHLPGALREQAERFRELLNRNEQESPGLLDICYTAACRRSHLQCRLAVAGSSRQELAEMLVPFTGHVENATEKPSSQRVVFVFPGQGGQWIGMGRAFYEQGGAFKSTLDRIDLVFRDLAGWSVVDLIFCEEADWNEDISRIQPALFAVQVAMSELWRSLGVHPDAVVGHSLGEVGAAAVAGALSLEDAVHVICLRSRLLARIRGQGAMAVVGLDLQAAEQAIAGFDEKVAIAVCNASSSTVLSGDPDAMAAILAELEARDVFCKLVDVDVASHSPQVAPLLDDLREALSACRPAGGGVPFYSTVKAQRVAGDTLDAEYWASNMRRPVRFAETSRLLLRDDHDIFIEVGPHPVLLSPLLQTARATKSNAIAVGSMRRDEPNRSSFFNALAAVYMQGHPISWSAVYPSGRCISLPDYPFQREPFWFDESETNATDTDEESVRRTAGGERPHPLLPRHFKLGSDEQTWIWEVPLSTRRFPYLAEHRVRGSAVLPGAVYVEMALAAAREMFPERRFALEDIEFLDCLAVSTDRSRILQIELRRLEPKEALIRFFSFDDQKGEASPSKLHATARLRLEPERIDRTNAGQRGAALEVRSELLLEALGLEFDRRHTNSSYHFGVISLFVSPGSSDGERPQQMSDQSLIDQIIARVRRGDTVHPMGSGQFVVILEGISSRGALEIVASRIYHALTDGSGQPRPNRVGPIMIFGDVMDAARTEAAQVLRDALDGRLAPLCVSDQMLGDGTRHEQTMAPEAFYASMQARGIQYGSAFRSVRQVRYCGQSSYGDLELSKEIEEAMGQHLLHPAILDGCFQAAAAAFLDNAPNVTPDETFLPVGIHRLVYHRPPCGRLQTRGWYRGRTGPGGEEIEVDFAVTTPGGDLVVEVDGFRMRRTAKHARLLSGEAFEDWFHQWEWRHLDVALEAGDPRGGGGETKLDSHGSNQGVFLVVDGDTEVGEVFAAAAEARGLRCIRVARQDLDGSRSEDARPIEGSSCEPARTAQPSANVPGCGGGWKHLVKRQEMGALRGVIYLSVVGNESTECSGSELMASSIELAHGALQLLQGLSELAGSEVPLPVWWVTSGAWRVLDSDRDISATQATLWGLGRVVSNERPDIAMRLADLGHGWPDSDLAELAAHVARPDTENETAIRDGRRYVHRLVQTPVVADVPRSVPRRIWPDGPFRVDVEHRHDTRVPVLRLDTCRPLAPHRVRVRVDVAAIRRPAGMWRPNGDTGGQGTIAEVGDEVTGLEPGDRVVVLVPGATARRGVLLARYVVVAPELVHKIDDQLSEQYASLPLFHLPAWIGLHWLGRVRPEDKVLVISATSELGRIAALMAAGLGAQVTAVAETLEARIRLRGQGVRYVLSPEAIRSRDLLWDLAGHHGFDLLLSTQSRHELAPALEVVAPGGRVVELLETGADSSPQPETHSRNVAHSCLEMETLATKRPEVMRSAMQDLLERASSLPALSQDSIAVETLENVDLDQLNSSKPALLVRMDAGPLRVGEMLAKDTLLQKEASYLITGGTGGLGVLLTRWLSARGAGHIILLSRTGHVSPSLTSVLEEARASGAEIIIEKGDASDASTLQAVLDRTRTAHPPIAGVFHLAGVLADATLDGQSRERLAAAMSPKIIGAWNLHRFTLDQELDHFVLFSSAATTLGSPGQGNYAAANAFLDALAHHRRSQGLPAISINWGTWGEAGLAAAQDNRGGRLESRGLFSMTPGDAFKALERAMLYDGPPDIGIFSIDWNRWAKAFANTTRSPSFAHLVQPEQSDTPENADDNLREQLRTVGIEERQAMMMSYLRRQFADALRMPISRVTPTQRLARLGMDSLMTIELRGRLQNDLAVDVSPTRILEMENLSAFAKSLLELLDSAQEGQHAPHSLGEMKDAMPEVQLDTAIEATALAPTTENPGDVLLSGATGFVGAHILRTLLDRTNARVHCLVRGESKEAAGRRLHQVMTGLKLWRQRDSARIDPIIGDLAQRMFGLEPDDFRALAGRIEAVYHCGAWVNHVYPYSELEAANVGGTEEMLRFAVTGRPKPVHHVSTIAVFPFTVDPQREISFDEDSPLEDRSEPFFSGYAVTKWAAEQLVIQARKRGLNVNIYRAGLITGSSHAGICPETDAIWRIVQAVAALGQAPRLTRGLSLTPVDFVARALVDLSLRQDSVNQSYHLLNPRSFHVSDVLECLRKLGYQVEVVESRHWKNALAERLDKTSPLYPLLPKIQEIDLPALDQARIGLECQKTLSRLDKQTRMASSPGRALLFKYLARMVKSGFLPQPDPPLARVDETTGRDREGASFELRT